MVVLPIGVARAAMRSPGRQAKASEASPRGQMRGFAGRYDQTI
ncbi:hypothetical protein [Novosphingobium resinovorum]|nr:hypothetical protein [Novosphingobium resinovorum]